ncbi:MAG: carbon-nitrogen hydrolase family protein [Rhodobacteraceae bacterium]|nr:carbon-nitrogen hydrolase family protein [Paracoccaceae bacterium]
MSSFKAACIQLNSTQEAERNLKDMSALIREAAGQGVFFAQTPEMSNLLVTRRADLEAAVQDEAADVTLAAMRALADELSIWLHIGSLAVRSQDGRIANRGYLISPKGLVHAHYDKIHMFDVDLPNGESWRESATYEPGTVSVVAELPWIRMGMAICYDVRFPHLFRDQAKRGAGLLSAPAAFTRQTGEAHWHVLQRSRAIENGAYVMSAAQGGLHEDGRETFGHSLIVGPWGEILAEKADDQPGVIVAEIDPAAVENARQRIPSLKNERAFSNMDVALENDQEKSQ